MEKDDNSDETVINFAEVDVSFVEVVINSVEVDDRIMETDDNFPAINPSNLKRSNGLPAFD